MSATIGAARRRRAPRCTNARPSMPVSVRSSPTRPLRPSGTSTWVVSPVTTTFEPKPMRVRNIFICSGVVFCASSRMMKLLFSVRPRMNASGATSTACRSSSFCAPSGSTMSYRASYSGRRYGSILAIRSPGRNPSRSPASTAGRVRMMRCTCLVCSACTAIATASQLLPGAGRAEAEGDHVARGWRRCSASDRPSSGGPACPWRRARMSSVSTRLGRSSSCIMSIAASQAARRRDAGRAGAARPAPRTAARRARPAAPAR